MVEGAKSPPAPKRSLGPYLLAGAVLVLCALVLAGVVVVFLASQFLTGFAGTLFPGFSLGGGQMFSNGTWAPNTANGYPINITPPGVIPGNNPLNTPNPGGTIGGLPAGRLPSGINVPNNSPNAPGPYTGYPSGNTGQPGASGTGRTGTSGGAGGAPGQPGTQNPAQPGAPNPGLPFDPNNPFNPFGGTDPATGASCQSFTQACNVAQPCCQGLVCTTGICQLNLPGLTTCIDSDVQDNGAAGAAVTVVNGAMTDMKIDTCFNANTLDEYDCAPNGAILHYQQNCPQGCQNGECIGIAAPNPPGPNAPGGVPPGFGAIPTCYDSDNGINYAEQGTMAANGTDPATDNCLNTRFLEEYYCSPGGEPMKIGYALPAGTICENGAVYPRDGSTPACTDSDGGQMPNEKGTLSSTNGFTISDTCLDSHTVLEWYCTSGGHDSIATNCSANAICQDGACVATTPANQPPTTPAGQCNIIAMPCGPSPYGTDYGTCCPEYACTNGLCLPNLNGNSGSCQTIATACSNTGNISANCCTGLACMGGLCLPIPPGACQPPAAPCSIGYNGVNYGSCCSGNSCTNGLCMPAQTSACQPTSAPCGISDNGVNYGSCCTGETCFKGFCQTETAPTTPSTQTPYACMMVNAPCGNTPDGKSYDPCCNGLSCVANNCRNLTASDRCKDVGGTCGRDNSGYFNGDCCQGLTCDYNVCKRPNVGVVTCSDSDGGNFSYTQGTVSVYINGSLHGTTTDWCDYPGSSVLHEYNCLPDGTGTIIDIDCANGCSNGACLTSPSTPSSCTPLNMACGVGYTSCCSGLSCSNNYCKNLSATATPNTACQQQVGGTCDSWMTCCPGMFCGDNGRCQNSTYTPPPSGGSASFSCNDSDGGLAYNTLGTVTSTLGSGTDYCYNSTTLMEYRCVDNGFGAVPYNCPNGGYCSNGICIASASGTGGTAGSTTNCTDNDGGINISVKGTVVTPYSGTYTDSCYNSTQVIEYYCYGNSYGTAVRQCGSYCSDGACVTLTAAGSQDSGHAATCTDNDGGNVPTTRGTVSYGTGQSVTDTCRDTNTLLEYVCNGTQMAYKVINCSTPCSNGVCTPARWCRDSDNGQNYGVLGTVTTDYGATVTDYCYNTSAVVEYSCSGYYLGLGIHECGSGYKCSGGICMVR